MWIRRDIIKSMRFLISHSKFARQARNITARNVTVRNLQRGFTLIELMVTIGIFVFMTALVLGRYNTFGADTVFTSMAYDVAFTLRQAQAYGLGVKNSSDSGVANFSIGYGVHFDTTDAGKFTLFKDSNANKVYDNTEGLTSYNLKHGVTIDSMCVGTSDCGGAPVNQYIDISFLRPDPKANICADNVGNCNFTYAKIRLKSADGSMLRDVIVTRMGQISVVTNPAP